ncbi:40-residue YVTN family beta-propeller, partial [Bacillus thuringiensis]
GPTGATGSLIGPTGPRLYIINRPGSVSVLDKNSFFRITTIAGLPSSDVITSSVSKRRVYVGADTSNSVYVIDAQTNAILDIIPIPGKAEGLSINDSTNMLYATNFNNANVSVIDTNTNMIVATIPVGNRPEGVAVNMSTGNVYVLNENNPASVSIIDASNTVIATVTVGNNFTTEYLYNIDVNNITGFAYVANYNDGTVSVIDNLNVVVDTITVGSFPTGIAVNPSLNKVYVTNSVSNNVSIIDISSLPGNIIATVPAGNLPLSVIVDIMTNNVYVTVYNDNNVRVIDGNTNFVANVIPAGSTPMQSTILNTTFPS